MNSILGVCVGDAIGAYLEFYKRDITEELAKYAMTLPGGGCFKVGPGQITDDGELTLALWNAINKSHPSYGFPIYSVIKVYSNWYESSPFDIGMTCSNSFDLMSQLLYNNSIDDTQIDTLKKDIYEMNRYSEANGALMRASAIATWVAKYPEIPAYTGAEYAMEDASLSHPSQTCKEVNAIYVFTVINLLRGIHPSDTLKYTDEFVKMNSFSEKVKKWYFEESLDIDTINAKEQIGHVRWAFVMSFYFLRHPEITYEEAIKITIMKGGDTDTNAAIVGGLVATYSTIPEYMINSVLQFDCTKEGRIRPSEYSVKKTIR